MNLDPQEAEYEPLSFEADYESLPNPNPNSNQRPVPIRKPPSHVGDFTPSLPPETRLYFALKLAFLQTVKNPPAIWETWVQSLGREDPLEEGVNT